MILLFLHGYFSANLKAGIAGNGTQTANPAALTFFGNKSERRAVIKLGNGDAKRTTNNLSATAFQFKTVPAVILVNAT